MPLLHPCCARQQVVRGNHNIAATLYEAALVRDPVAARRTAHLLYRTELSILVEATTRVDKILRFRSISGAYLRVRACSASQTHARSCVRMRLMQLHANAPRSLSPASRVWTETGTTQKDMRAVRGEEETPKLVYPDLISKQVPAEFGTSSPPRPFAARVARAFFVPAHPRLGRASDSHMCRGRCSLPAARRWVSSRVQLVLTR